MDFDIREIAAETNAAWRSELREIKADGVTAYAIELRKGEHKVLENLKPLIDSWRTRPERIVGTATMQTPEKFIELVTRHGDPGASALFCDAMSASPSIQAVIDYHGNLGDPDWMKHRVKYNFPLSREWQFWMQIDAKGRLDQEQFAFLIEERIADVVKADPKNAAEVELAAQMGVTIATPAELLTLSRGLMVRVEQTVKEILNPSSGEDQIAFEENHKGENGKPIKVPGMFILSIPVFHGDDPVRVAVRLRYRMIEKKIVWIPQLYRPDRILLDKVQHVAEQARIATSLPLFYGSPEA